MAPTAVRIEAFGSVRVGMGGSCWRQRKARSVCVVALKGSPTTRKATSMVSASLRMSSEADSTVSRSARIMLRP